MSYSNTNLIIGPGVDDFITNGGGQAATAIVKARVPPAYKRKIEAIMAETGLNESEVLRDLITRAVVMRVIKETGILGVSNGQGTEPVV